MNQRDDRPQDHVELGEASPATAVALRWITRLVVVLTGVGLVVPGDAGRSIAWLVALTLIAVPVLRVLWLGARWFRRGDRRYAAAADLLAVVVLTGAVITALLG